MRQFPRRIRAAMMSAVALGTLLASCSDNGPTGPSPAVLEIVALSGSGQVALAGQPLPERFEVRVQESGTGKPSAGVTVDWTVVTGDGASMSPPRGVTDANGTTSARLTLGPNLGEYRVEASFDGLTRPAASFVASAMLEPELGSLSPDPVAAGGTLTLEGSNFSASAGDNVVLFSGIRGQVVSATPTRLQVIAPPCLPERQVTITVRLGSLESNALDLSVEGGSQLLELALGEHITFQEATGLDCVRLPEANGREYLAVISTASQVAAAQWSYVLTGLTEAGADQSSQPSRAPSPAAAVGSRQAPMEGPQAEWDRALRRQEARFLEAPRPEPAAARGAAAQVVPEIGERRDFSVLNRDMEYTPVTAEVVFVGDHAAIYMDLDAPQPGLGPSDLASLAADFDDPIFATATDVFGEASDLDGNGRIAILFTPVVNQLTATGADGFVGGFFFGLDLLPEQPNSNGGEVFYALVPDPGGQFGDARSVALVMDVIPAILAHEFQHMIGFGERILTLGGNEQEALWLSEGLAQMAEDVVGEAFLSRGETAKAVQYQSGNWIRAERYLRDPGDVSLIVKQGNGTLAERGGGWLFVRYLRAQRGSNQILGALTRTTSVGVANVVAATGRSWEDQFPEWSAALYLSGTSLPADPRLLFPDMDLRSTIEEVTTPYPLVPVEAGARDFQAQDRLWSSSADYFLIRPEAGGSVSLSLSGSELGDAPAEARLRLTLVRTR
jgi:hypothetical protein